MHFICDCVYIMYCVYCGVCVIYIYTHTHKENALKYQCLLKYY